GRALVDFGADLVLSKVEPLGLLKDLLDTARIPSWQRQVDEALRAKEEGKPRVIVFNFSGHGHFDMAAYDSYFSGTLVNHEHPQEEILRALEDLPKVPAEV
ncbi:MAG: hypothetical protein ACP5TV_01160, partial [Anaerolineae bacterium]